MRIKLRNLAISLIATGAAAAAIAVAPNAAASVNPTNCNDKGGASVCQRQGHSSIRVDPPPRANQRLFGPFGTGPGMIPLWALD